MPHNLREAHRRLPAPLLQAPRTMQRSIDRRKRRGVAEKLSAKRRNVLARKPAGRSMINKTVGHVIGIDRDRDLPPAEDGVTRETVTASRLPMTARSAVPG